MKLWENRKIKCSHPTVISSESPSCWNYGWEEWGQWGDHLQGAVMTAGWIVDATGGDGPCTHLHMLYVRLSSFSCWTLHQRLSLGTYFHHEYML